MILQSLYEYYEILVKAGEVPHPGYVIANVSYALNLSPQGELLNVIPLKQSVTRGKKTVEVPRPMEVPEQENKTSGIKPNFLCENSSYVLGVDAKGKPERVKKCFSAFAELHHRILDGVDSIPAKAVLAFIDSWQPEKAQKCEALKNFYNDIIAGANIVFMIQGIGYAHQDKAIRTAWENYRSKNSSKVYMQCLVTGKVEPIARLHPRIKGIKNAQMVVSLVSFNESAFESYGHEFKDDTGQGLNAPVSEYAAFAYGTALNYLLADTEHRQVIGDTTVVYWAMSPKKIYRDLFSFALNPVKKSDSDGEMAVDKAAEGELEGIFKRIVQGKPVSEDAKYSFDSSTRFYVLGLAPNAGRLSVQFFLANTFGNILENVAQHYRDLEIEKSPSDFEYLPVWKLLDESVPSISREKPAYRLLTSEMMRSILSGLPYPELFLSNAILRIRSEQDNADKNTHKITRGRAAIIKACLIRKNDDRIKEVLTVSLREESNNRAYVLGRLFAVLEKAQQDANPGINSTIKDRYFASACTAPATVFPILLRLSKHHIAKSEYGTVNERRIRDLLDKLDVEQEPFPAHLSLNEQGVFILGYYHQQKAIYTKSDKEDK
ncbi:MAG: type I-C CRISPR-associated protein Cas8c/Csd1 [[Clostridium] cellulosi]